MVLEVVDREHLVLNKHVNELYQVKSVKPFFDSHFAHEFLRFEDIVSHFDTFLGRVSELQEVSLQLGH